jgi:carbamoyl-phosphate synthase large subunit
MSSTGEVGCIGDNYYEAILKAMLSVGYTIPKKNILLSTGPLRSKVELVNSCKMLIEKEYNLYATHGTHEFLKLNGIESIDLAWPDEEIMPNVVEHLANGQIDLVINIPKNLSSHELSNDYTIRRSSIDFNIPLITNARLASAFIYAICKMDLEDISIKSWGEYK